MNRSVEIQVHTRMMQVEHAVKDTMTLISAYSGRHLSHSEAVQYVQSFNNILVSASLPLGSTVDIS
jgi:hypothetical protein